MNSLNDLRTIDWDFADSARENGRHAFHPYPAKFISHIPARLIDALSEPGETVLDPFCGSGTTLVEAATRGRVALGADVNPVAVLVSQAKTLKPGPQDGLAAEALVLSVDASYGYMSGRPTLGSRETTPLVPEDKSLSFWFEPQIVREMGLINAAIVAGDNWRIGLLARVALSSITVGVSNQDSDTRYVRRDKGLKAGVVVQRFRSKLHDMLVELESQPTAEIYAQTWLGDARRLPLADSSVDLVVTSPPYPNAYSYHLYHRTRLVWLGFDPLAVKRSEIGSHRHYSARNGPGRETFKSDMVQCFEGLRRALRPGRFACFVIGDSIVRGQPIDNSAVLAEAAEEAGFSLAEQYDRKIDPRRKSFNPAIGKIKQEHILVFRSP